MDMYVFNLLELPLGTGKIITRVGNRAKGVFRAGRKRVTLV
jgi:hypothetical protein